MFTWVQVIFPYKRFLWSAVFVCLNCCLKDNHLVRWRVSKYVTDRYKTCDIRTWKKELFLDVSSTKNGTLVPSLYQCVETHNTEAFWLLSQPLPPHPFQPATLLDPIVNRFTRQTLSTLNRKYFFMNVLFIESFCSQKMHSITVLFGSILLNYGRHFDYLNQPLNMRMSVCYLDSYEAGLCCYLVIHTENLLRPLQLFYFHLCPVYWASFVH
jgi:hypothetical protein